MPMLEPLNYDFLDVQKEILEDRKREAEYAGVSLSEWLLYLISLDTETLIQDMYHKKNQN